ncbi:MAG: radical SAM family heme chaperone HemW [Elusimicrobiota bacterium]
MHRREPLGLYVHVPFCAVKCFYCDFVAFSGQGGRVDRYLDAVLCESRMRGGASPDTLYIGGGTPSELSADQLRRLLAGLDLPELREATFEANPESMDEEKLDVLARGGVTRLSLGLQAAQERLLRTLGRRHSWGDFARVFAAARARGLAVNVDLMCGLPGQSRADSGESIDRVLALAPEHVSLYGLSVEDRTLFKKRAVQVDEDESRRMLEDAHARLARAGLRHYEISNFARPGAESRHNINYWRNGSYVGLGCGAAGFIGGTRYNNEETLSRYLDRVDRGERPVASSERLKGKEKAGETLLLGLRLIDGIGLAPGVQEMFRPELEGLLARGLVELAGGCSRSLPRLRLTREGLFLSNEVFREFVPPYADAERT